MKCEWMTETSFKKCKIEELSDQTENPTASDTESTSPTKH